MRLDFTTAVVLALDRARQLARHQGSPAVEPVHLLQGLLHEEEGHAALLLARWGLNVQTLKEPWLTVAFAAPPVAEDDIALSEPTRLILRQAAELNSSLSAEGSIASDQVILALLRAETTLRQRLETLGLDFAGLKENLEVAQGPPLPLDEPLLFQEPVDLVAAARIIDANANRAREALRVLEDYTRFALNDAYLSRELKTLRHDLTEALNQWTPGHLLESRDTPGDVGTVLTTVQEQERPSLLAVVQANSKRLQEALRSLEEYGKMCSPILGQALEKLRYQAYTLEQALVLGSRGRQRLADARLYLLISQEQCKLSLAGTIAEAAAGGVQIIQLREKNLDDRTLLERARDVRRLTRKYGVLFIMNDRPDLAVLAEADGVHLGQEDLPIRDARRMVGPEALIGVSTHNMDQLRQAIRQGASYVGVGPTFSSATKTFTELAGLTFVSQALAETSLPAFVLGGITLDNLKQVVAAGARRVAVGHALCQADDPQSVARTMRQILEG